MKYGIIGAMDVEMDFLKSKIENPKITEAGGLKFFEGKIGTNEVVAVKSGVGKVNAALCAQNLILKFGAEVVINTGVAGGMVPSLEPLDFVVSTDAVYHDMDATGFGYKPCEIPQMGVLSFKADENLAKKVEAIFKASTTATDIFSGHKMILGRVATGDQFISDKAVKNHIKEICNPACVEMEGAAIAHACFLNKTPFLIIRCISDKAEDVKTSEYEFNEEAGGKMSGELVLRLVSE